MKRTAKFQGKTYEVRSMGMSRGRTRGQYDFNGYENTGPAEKSEKKAMFDEDGNKCFTCTNPAEVRDLDNRVVGSVKIKESE